MIGADFAPLFRNIFFLAIFGASIILLITLTIIAIVVWMVLQ